MRFARAITLVAPLALGLAACGDTTPADEATSEAADVPVNLPKIDPRFPSVVPNARTSVDYAGTYAQPVANGERSITLKTDGTYTMRDQNGVETTGTYNWYDDNSRILIKNNGENMVYAIADGTLYRMPDADSPTTGTMTEEQTYRRVVGPGGAMGATGTSSAAAGATATPTAQ